MFSPTEYWFLWFLLVFGLFLGGFGGELSLYYARLNMWTLWESGDRSLALFCPSSRVDYPSLWLVSPFLVRFPLLGGLSSIFDRWLVWELGLLPVPPYFFVLPFYYCQFGWFSCLWVFCVVLLS